MILPATQYIFEVVWLNVYMKDAMSYYRFTVLHVLKEKQHFSVFQ